MSGLLCFLLIDWLVDRLMVSCIMLEIGGSIFGKG